MIDQLMDWSHACGLPITDAIKAPLAFLFEDKAYSSSSIVKDKATSEPIRYSHLTRSTLRFHRQSHSAESQNTKHLLFCFRFTRRCISVAPSREMAGELLLGKTRSKPPSHDPCVAAKIICCVLRVCRKIWDVLCGG